MKQYAYIFASYLKHKAREETNTKLLILNIYIMTTSQNIINQVSKSFKGIITDAKNASVSASKLIDLIKEDNRSSDDFVSYLNSLDFILTYEGKTSNVTQMVHYYKTVKPSQFVAFLAKNCKDGRKLDGSSLLGAIKTVASVKALELLVLENK